MTKLSESIRLYARLLLGSQFQGKASILGNNAENFSVRQLYLQELKTIVERPENIQTDLDEFQRLLKYAATPVNFAVLPQCYMIPSDLNLHVGKIMNYNNNILIAPESAKVGEMQHLNHQDPFQGKKEKSHQLPHDDHLQQKLSAKTHEDEKQALVIGLTALMVGVIWFFKK